MKYSYIGIYKKIVEPSDEFDSFVQSLLFFNEIIERGFNYLLELLAKSKKVVSICIMVFKRFSWNFSLASSVIVSNLTPPLSKIFAVSGTL